MEINDMIEKQLIKEQEVFGQVTEADNYVLLDQKAQRICATEDECHVIVFWTKDVPMTMAHQQLKLYFALFFFKN